MTSVFDHVTYPCKGIKLLDVDESLNYEYFVTRKTVSNGENAFLRIASGNIQDLRSNFEAVEP